VIKKKIREPDTIVVPVQKDGFDRIILGENAWWAVRISAGMLPKIKHIAIYQRSPMWRQSHKSNLMGVAENLNWSFPSLQNRFLQFPSPTRRQVLCRDPDIQNSER
jgi:hypothetical protein